MRKMLTILVGVFTLVALLLAVGATLFLQGEFNKIEQENARRDVERATNALQNQVEALRVQAGDWGSWDDTYKFVGDHNAAYIESNLTNESIQNLGVNFMLFIDTQGKVVEARGVDVETGEDMEVPGSLLNAFKPDGKLLSESDESARSGYLGIDDQILLFATRPILTSLGEGPYHGTLVFSRYLSSSEIEGLAEAASLTLSYQRIDSTETSQDVQDMTDELKSGNGIIVRALPDAKMAGYGLVKDIHGNPLFVAKVEASRMTYIEARQALLYYLMALVVVVTLATVTSIYATNQMNAKDKIIRLKDEFFSIATHEIRTPLAAIRGNSQMLGQIYGPSNDHYFQEMVEDIHSSSERLIRMVTNFLDLARLEQDKIPIKIESFAIGTVAGEVINEMKVITKERKLEIITKLPDDLPHVNADKDRVKQVIYNLVGNSLKFTEQGSITLTARPEKGLLVVSVADTGRGISPEGQRALFKKFHQTKHDDVYKGSGLGLYISKVLVEKMGGSMNLESSEEGKGTTISFSLPLA